jgi:circadian clock protein KaiC
MLEHEVTSEKVSSGVPELDEMFEGKGFYKGSTILVSGTAGTGKSSLAAHFANASCNRGERVMYFAFEESPSQIIRNMRSIGVDLKTWVSKGLLVFHSIRPSIYGLEMHLAIMHREIDKFKPDSVILDPINSFMSFKNDVDVKGMAVKLIDYLKSNRITGFFTSLTSDEQHNNSVLYVSSLIDTWILLKDLEMSGERNRGLQILKSRGIAHSNQIREFLITNNGIHLQDIYVGLEGTLTGSARLAQEIRENREARKIKENLQKKRLALERKRKAVEAEIEAIKRTFESEEIDLMEDIGHEESMMNSIEKEEEQMARNRKVGKSFKRPVI